MLGIKRKEEEPLLMINENKKIPGVGFWGRASGAGKNVIEAFQEILGEC